MCDPVTIGGAVLTGLSMFVNSGAGDDIDAARHGVMARESQRQRQYNAEVDDITSKSRERYDKFGDKQSDKTKELVDYYKGENGALPTEGATAGVLPTSTNVIVQDDAKRTQGRVKAFGAQQDAALGNLRSFGDVLGNISRDQALDAVNAGLVGGFKRASSALVPLELEQANRAGDSNKMFGDILGGVGKLGVMAGLSGFGASGVNPAAGTGGLGSNYKLGWY